MKRRSPSATGRTARLTRSPLGRDRTRDDTLRRRSPLDIRSDRERSRISKMMVYKAMSEASGDTLGRRRAFTHGYTRRRLTAQHAQRTLPMPEGGRYTHGEGAVVETTDARTARTEGTPMTRVVFRGNADPSPPRRARGGTASKLRPTAAEVPIPAITHNERPHDA